MVLFCIGPMYIEFRSIDFVATKLSPLKRRDLNVERVWKLDVNLIDVRVCSL